MKETLLIFDVDRNATAFRNAMFKLKYSKFLNTITNLPSGALVHKEKTENQAVSDAENICIHLKIKLLRCAAFTIPSNWQAIIGEKI